MFRSPRSLSPDGAAREVLAAVPDRRGPAANGNALFLEYGDALPGETLFATAPIGQEDRAALPDAVPGVCQWINISYLWRPTLGDESGNHLAGLAVAGNAAWTVTGNERDAAAGEPVFGGFRAVTPGAWLKEGGWHGDTADAHRGRLAARRGLSLNKLMEELPVRAPAEHGTGMRFRMRAAVPGAA